MRSHSQSGQAAVTRIVLTVGGIGRLALSVRLDMYDWSDRIRTRPVTASSNRGIMHELSIARSLLRMVGRNTPPGARVRDVHVRVGPLQAIEPEAMQWAWRASTVGTDCQDAVLHLELLPWKIKCPTCGRCWEGQDPLEVCECGSQAGHPTGGDELILVSLRVEEAATIEGSANTAP